MSTYDLFQKRLATYDAISLDKLVEDKMKTFKIALQRGYNRELVSNKEGTQFLCLISGINTQPKIEKKSFSTLLDNACAVGDILYWERNGSRWLITDQEETEKSIFQGYISEASYQLKWVNSTTGENFSEWACVKGPEETIITDGVKNSIQYDEPNQSLYLMMPKNSAGMELLDRYFEIFVGNRKWEIQAIDNYTYKNLVTLQLLETSINRDADDTTNNIADGKIINTYTISSSLTNLTSVELNTVLSFEPILYANGEKIILPYDIVCENCSYANGAITFDILDTATIEITYEGITTPFEYSIGVTSESQTLPLEIIGSSNVKVMTTNTYILQGYSEGDTVVWSIDTDYLTIVSVDNETVVIKARNKIGTTNLICTVNDVEYSKEIKITSLFS
jgi:hypothetical protein